MAIPESVDGHRVVLVTVSVPVEEAELAAEALWQAGAAAVEERPMAAGRAVLVADVVPAEVGEGWIVTTEVVDDGLDGWRVHATPWRAGPSSRLVVQPPWCAPLASARPDDVVLPIDASRAFGSGSHPTTRLCLVALEQVTPGTWCHTVLDVGCGSGVLAVAAAVLGAGRVEAVDLSAVAVATTDANAAAAGVADRVHASTTAVADLTGPYQLVLANIGAATLRALAPDLARLTDPGGTLVLSGLLAAQVDEVTPTFEAAGCAVVSSADEDGWSVVILRRDPGGAAW